MRKLPKRVPFELIIISGLLLGSCSKPAWEERLDLAEANASNAIVKVNDLESRVEELEMKLHTNGY